jgi:hypothetical protein
LPASTMRAREVSRVTPTFSALIRRSYAVAQRGTTMT